MAAQNAVFIGQFEYSLDSKGRLAIPSAFRTMWRVWSEVLLRAFPFADQYIHYLTASIANHGLGGCFENLHSARNLDGVTALRALEGTKGTHGESLPENGLSVGTP